jgi:hypothetical protein
MVCPRIIPFMLKIKVHLMLPSSPKIKSVLQACVQVRLTHMCPFEHKHSPLSFVLTTQLQAYIIYVHQVEILSNIMLKVTFLHS